MVTDEHVEYTVRDAIRDMSRLWIMLVYLQR